MINSVLCQDTTGFVNVAQIRDLQQSISYGVFFSCEATLDNTKNVPPSLRPLMIIGIF